MTYIIPVIVTITPATNTKATRLNVKNLRTGQTSKHSFDYGASDACEAAVREAFELAEDTEVERVDEVANTSRVYLIHDTSE